MATTDFADQNGNNCGSIHSKFVVFCSIFFVYLSYPFFFFSWFLRPAVLFFLTVCDRTSDVYVKYVRTDKRQMNPVTYLSCALAMAYSTFSRVGAWVLLCVKVNLQGWVKSKMPEAQWQCVSQRGGKVAARPLGELNLRTAAGFLLFSVERLDRPVETEKQTKEEALVSAIG